MRNASNRSGDHDIDPFDRLIDRLHDVRVKRPGFAYARCPAHDDRKRSLTVQRGCSVVLVRCFRGCSIEEVCRAVGMTVGDLRYGRQADGGSARVICAYDYATQEGVRVQKERWHPKSFRWKRPDPAEPTGWSYGMRGLRPRLYRIDDLVDEHVVAVTEGEKSTDILLTHGIAATCPPYGASVWRDEWADALWSVGCRLAVVFSDADRSGWTQAARAAERIPAETRYRSTLLHRGQGRQLLL